MARKWIVLVAAMGGIAGCTVEEVTTNTAAEQSLPQSESSAENIPDETIDPFYLAIEAERWNVMLENALGRQSDRPSATDENDDVLRVHRALQAGVANLIQLRDDVCRKGLLDIGECQGIDIPDWAVDWEADLPTLSELQARSDWLGEAIQPFVDVACQNDTGEWVLACMVE